MVLGGKPPGLRSAGFSRKSLPLISQWTMRILFVLVVVDGLVLGYGYYHAATHGALYISLIVKS